MSTKEYVDNMVSSLKQTRDELKLKAHLARADMKDEWDRLEDKYQQMRAEYEPAKQAAGDAADDVWESIKQVGEELRVGFQKIRASM